LRDQPGLESVDQASRDILDCEYPFRSHRPPAIRQVRNLLYIERTKLDKFILDRVFLILPVYLIAHSVFIAKRYIRLVYSYACLFEELLRALYTLTTTYERRSLVLAALSLRRPLVRRYSRLHIIRGRRLDYDHVCVILLRLRTVAGLLLWPYDPFSRILRLCQLLLGLGLGLLAPWMRLCSLRAGSFIVRTLL
jgi:hypothetical protein